MPRVLAILADGFEEIETLAPVDLLRRAGIEVVMASLGKDIHVQGRCGVVIHADSLLDKVSAEPFDCLFLPGGPGVKLLRADPRVSGLVKAYAAKDLWLAAICAAPAVLHDAGLLKGKRYTAHASVAQELTETQAALRVAVDGKLLTSRGAGTSLDFGLSLVEQLAGKAKAEEIAASITY